MQVHGQKICSTSQAKKNRLLLAAINGDELGKTDLMTKMEETRNYGVVSWQCFPLSVLNPIDDEIRR